jgi:tRNA-splicing ligase RtcB
METGSALLVGTATAMAETFGSTAHGAGRVLSRGEAKRRVKGAALIADPAARGIVLRARSTWGAAEEAGLAYKDLGDVVAVCERTGIAHHVATFTPLGNVKG